MDNYEELKSFCDKKIEEYPKYLKKYKKEILVAKRFYNAGRDLVKELQEKKDKIDNRYIIPFLLNITNKVIDEPFEYIKVKAGSSGGIDIDVDVQPSFRDSIFEYVKNKYGEENVIRVGTFGRLGFSSASKDLLRVYKIDYAESNKFTKILTEDLSWEENLLAIKESYPDQYNFYLNNKVVLDMVPKFVNKIRSIGTHAGGIVISDKPIWKYIPVERSSGTLATGYPESGQEAVLDEMNLIKLDLLGIEVLDIERKTLELIEEKLFLIEENGIQKIVPSSYKINYQGKDISIEEFIKIS